MRSEASVAQIEVTPEVAVYPFYEKNASISFIIPTLNEERNLDLCLSSLKNQTEKDFEVIIVDGGSKDRTIEIAEKYGFHVLEVEKTRAHDVSSAKNVGVYNASGDHVFFLDADMAIDPNCIEVLKEGFKDPNIVGIALKVLPYKGNHVETIMYQMNNAFAMIAHRMKFYQFSYFSCHCYRRNAFLKAGGFREDLLACEDLDLSLRVSNYGKYRVTHNSRLWTSPRRLREWSYTLYILKYLKYLFEYYFTGTVKDPYTDMS